MENRHFVRLGIMAKPSSPLAPEGINRIMEWGKNNKVEILTDKATASLVNAEGTDNKDFFRSIEGLIVLGGDGTLLAAARAVKDDMLPLLGINLGSLGFITEVAFDEIESALDNLATGNYRIEERMMLNLKGGKAGSSGQNVALNDIVFSRKSLAKMIELTITVNGQHVSRYRADGLIVSTPTGSTAYALSAGGPILYPLLDSLVICPICPHTLTNRPIVIPGDSVVEMDIAEGQEEVIATLDGQVSIDIEANEHLTITRSDRVTRLIKVPDRTHYDTLRGKLGWGGTAT